MATEGASAGEGGGVKVRIASDLHLEFFRLVAVEKLADHFLPPDPRDGEAVLILAGDISAKPLQLVEFIRCIEDRFRHIVYVPGNHEYYGHEFEAWNSEARAALAEVQRFTAAIDCTATADVDGVRFIACTLWASGGASARERKLVAEGMMDFRQIKFQGRPFLVSDMQRLYGLHRASLAGSLHAAATQSPESAVVVVTHHLPSFKLCHPRFGVELNGGFASDCDWLLEGKQAPALWVHGHTHDSIDTTIGHTRVVCNPAGYQPEWNTRFNSYFAAPKFFEVAKP